MPNFSKALLYATYKGGRPGQRTDEHERAEHHQFKTKHLFKETKISKKLYVARLIQHFFIIKALETQLLAVPDKEESEISAFFALSYLSELWRTPGIECDLGQLGVKPSDIDERQIARSTQIYLDEIQKLPPKMLLAHYLLHVAGFMHGGNIINRRYIAPSNELTDYQISSQQYDFSKAQLIIGKKTPLALYADLMKNVDNIEMTEEDYQEALEQCKGVYQTMVEIYDDLSDMHIKQPLLSVEKFVLLCILLVVLAALVNSFKDYILSVDNNSSNSFT